ncbi:MAG: hypothetical protein Q9218_003679 [Villophora microphyllina]
MAAHPSTPCGGPGLQEWLEQLYFGDYNNKRLTEDEAKRLYFDDDADKSLTREEIIKLGNLIKRLLRIEPSDRATTREILGDPFLRDD